MNQGRLGFMTDIARADMLTCMEDLLDGRFVSETRMLLDAEVVRDGRDLATNLALNDIVIDKGAIGRMIEFELFIDGEFIYNLRADGLIVATPTGRPPMPCRPMGRSCTRRCPASVWCRSAPRADQPPGHRQRSGGD